MTKKKSLLIGATLLVLGVAFFAYAAGHPEAAFPWSNRVTFMLYGAYGWVLFKFLIGIPFGKKDLNNRLWRGIVYLTMAVVFFLMEVSGETVNIYTGVRGFVVLGALDIGVENLYLWAKEKGVHHESGT